MSLRYRVRYMPRDSLIHKLDPRVKMIAVILVVVTTLIFSDVTILFVLMLLTLALFRLSRLPVKLVFGYLKVFSPFFVLAIFLMGFTLGYSPSGRIVWSWGPLSLNTYGLEIGLILTLRLASIVSAAPLILMTISPDDLVIGLTSFRLPGTRWKLPYWFGFLVMATFRFIPIIQNELGMIMDAQKARARRDAEGNLVTRVKAVIPLLIPLVLNSFEYADQMSIAMETRAWGAPNERTSLTVLKMGERDYVFLLATLFLFGLAVLVRVLVGERLFLVVDPFFRYLHGMG